MSRSEPDGVVAPGQDAGEHLLPPWWFWLAIVLAVTAQAGMPLWEAVSSSRAAGTIQVLLVVLEVALASIETRRRYRGEVRLPRVRDSPSVVRISIPTLVGGFVLYCAIVVSVDRGHPAVALGLVVTVAMLANAGARWMRQAMRADIAAGRIRPARRPAAADDLRPARFTPGERVVWCGNGGTFEARAPLAYSGTFIADAPAPWVTIRHDGSPSDARVKPAQLFRESDYSDLVESRGFPPATPWG